VTPLAPSSSLLFCLNSSPTFASLHHSVPTLLYTPSFMDHGVIRLSEIKYDSINSSTVDR
jgi:hypothetical protein